jgi:hypothetical protein
VTVLVAIAVGIDRDLGPTGHELLLVEARDVIGRGTDPVLVDGE